MSCFHVYSKTREQKATDFGPSYHSHKIIIFELIALTYRLENSIHQYRYEIRLDGADIIWIRKYTL